MSTFNMTINCQCFWSNPFQEKLNFACWWGPVPTRPSMVGLVPNWLSHALTRPVRYQTGPPSRAIARVNMVTGQLNQVDQV
jgi:hypothetical protein